MNKSANDPKRRNLIEEINKEMSTYLELFESKSFYGINHYLDTYNNYKEIIDESIIESKNDLINDLEAIDQDHKQILLQHQSIDDQNKLLRLELEELFYENKKITAPIHELEILLNSIKNQNDSIHEFNKNSTKQSYFLQKLANKIDKINNENHSTGFIYSSSNNKKLVEEILFKFKDFIHVFDLETYSEGDFIKGSWLKKFRLKLIELFSHDRTIEKLEEIEKALQMRALDKPQAEIDSQKINAVSELINSLEKVDNVAIKMGSVLLIKTTAKNGKSNIVVKTLTSKEMLILEKNPEFSIDPVKLMKELNHQSKPDIEGDRSSVESERTP